MGKTDLKTPWSPTSSRLSGATSAWRNFSYDCFWMLMRFGMSMIFWIFAKLFRVRKLFWTVAGIRSPNDDWDAAGFQKGDAGALDRGGRRHACGRLRVRRSGAGGRGPRCPRGLPRLLDLDGGASRGELVLDLLGVVLVDAFLDRLRSALHQVLGLLQAQAGDGADLLDDVDLVGARVREDDRELGLLLGGSGDGNGGGGHAPLLLELLHELGSLHHREGGQRVDDLIQVCHGGIQPLNGT